MRAFTSDRFVLPLPDGHRFPMTKYSQLRERLLASGALAEDELAEAPAIDERSILRVHTQDYWQAVRDGTLDRRQQRAMGFPWSDAMVERSRRSVGATLAAARFALELAEGPLRCGVNLAGGTHHAFADRGEGFCVLNDVAIAMRALQAAGEVALGLVIDCDVHQGNGTAAIFRDDPSCFTASLHGAKNYPLRKERSDLDVALEDGCSDDRYLQELDSVLRTIDDRFFANGRLTGEPTITFYLAGADPFEGDRLGRLGLTKAGLLRRDRKVLRWCEERGLPVALVMAGGYADDVEDIVDIHAATVRLAAERSRARRAALSG